MRKRCCSIEGCDSVHFAKGLCRKHYNRLSRGDPSVYAAFLADVAERAALVRAATEKTKFCPRCERDLPATLEFFAKELRGAAGLTSHCKECRRVLARNDYLKHHEARLARRAAYRFANREKAAEYAAVWRKDNREAVCSYKRNHDARKRAAAGAHTVADVQAQYALQKGRCFYCKIKVGDKYHVDHVVPLALDGGNGPENIVISCPSCNCSKGAKHPMDFAGVMF